MSYLNRLSFTSQAEESKIMRSQSGKLTLYLGGMFTGKGDFRPRFEDWMNNVLRISNFKFNIQGELFLFLEASLAGALLFKMLPPN